VEDFGGTKQTGQLGADLLFDVRVPQEADRCKLP